MASQFGLTSPTDQLILSTFSITGSAASGTTFSGTLYPNGYQNASQTPYIVPAGRTLHIGDVAISSSPTVDGQLIFFINGTPQGEQFLLSSIVSSNSSRMRPTQSLVLNPGDTLSLSIITLAANGSTSTVSQNISIQGVLLPITTK